MPSHPYRAAVGAPRRTGEAANARREEDLSYLSNANARFLSENAMCVFTRHDLNVEVCGTSPALRHGAAVFARRVSGQQSGKPSRSPRCGRRLVGEVGLEPTKA